MKDKISERSFEKNGFTYTVYRVYDSDTDLSYLEDENRYSGCSPEDIEAYKQQDLKRIQAYCRSEWHMLGIIVEIAKKTKTNWFKPTVVGRGSCFGFESDADEKFLTDSELEIIADAELDLANLKEALCGDIHIDTAVRISRES